MSKSLTLKLAPLTASFDEARGCLRIVASAPVPDRDDEVVVPSTLRLDSYRRNPVVIWSHDQTRHPIARCEDGAGQFTCRLGPSGELVQEWYFAQTQAGREAAALYRQRVLRGASIGFLSDGLEDVPPDEAERLYGVRKRLRRHIGGELLETSAVPVPSCPGALALGWIDAPAAAKAYRSGGGVLVTKALAPFGGRRQAPRGGILPASSAKHPRGRHVSATATADTADLTTKDALGTTDDAAGGAVADTPSEPGDPHEMVKAGLSAAMHANLDALLAGDMDLDGFVAALKDHHADHSKYSGGGEDDGDGAEEDTDVVEKDDAADMKAVADMISKAVTEAVAAATKTLQDQLDGVLDNLDLMTK